MSLINTRSNPDADSLAAIYEPNQPGMMNPHARYTIEPKSPLEQMKLENMRAGFDQANNKEKNNNNNNNNNMILKMMEDEEEENKVITNIITTQKKEEIILKEAPLEFKIANKKTDAVKVVRKRKRMTFEMTKQQQQQEEEEEKSSQEQQQQQNNNNKKIKHVVNSPEAFMAMNLTQQQKETDKKRPYRVVTYKKDMIKGNMTHDEINLQVKTRSDPANRSIPAKLYSSLKYEVEQAIPRHVFLNKPKGVYMISISVVDPNNPHEEILKANETSMVAGIAQHTAMNMTNECVHVFLKLRFTDVSAHHNKRDFALRFDYFDSNMSIVEPMLSIVSAPFQIYARRPKQNKKRTYTRTVTTTNDEPTKRKKLNSGDFKSMSVSQLCEAIDEKRGKLALEEYNTILKHVMELQQALSPVDRVKVMAAKPKRENPSTEADLIQLYENQAVFDINAHFHRDDLFDDYLE
mmetsp:Transcript_3113/g.4584  ORF Transcript_3113/g.4584 Transcript_3113/m.4584 type:complete len:463 (-) Transcript_3113:26-1414(-)